MSRESGAERKAEMGKRKSKGGGRKERRIIVREGSSHMHRLLSTHSTMQGKDENDISHLRSAENGISRNEGNANKIYVRLNHIHIVACCSLHVKYIQKYIQYVFNRNERNLL